MERKEPERIPQKSYPTLPRQFLPVKPLQEQGKSVEKRTVPSWKKLLLLLTFTEHP